MVRVVKQLESSQVAIGWVLPPPPGVGVFSRGSWWPRHRIQLPPGGPSPPGRCCEDDSENPYCRHESLRSWQILTFGRCFAFWKWPNFSELSLETGEVGVTKK